MKSAPKRVVETNRPPWLTIALVVALAGLPRFLGIGQIGVRFDDESAYAHDARLWSRCARVALDGQALSAVARGDKEALRSRIEAIGVDFDARYLKPSQGYTFLGAAAMLAIGDDPSSIAVLNATLGTLSVVLLYLIACAWIGPGVGLLAAILYAVSPYDINYSRGLWAEASCTFFTLLGLWFWTRAHTIRVAPLGTRGIAQAEACGSDGRHAANAASLTTAFFLCGLALGYAITCHYRCAVVLLPLLIVDGMERLSLRRAGMNPPQSPLGMEGGSARAGWVRSWIALGLGAILPALLIESAFQLASVGAWVVGGELPFPTFLGGFIAWGEIIRSVGLTGAEHRIFYPQIFHALVECFSHWQGWIAMGLASIGLPLAWRAKGLARFAVLAPLVLVALLSLQRHAVARAFVPIIPMFTILVAIAVARISEAVTRARAARLAIAISMTIAALIPTLAPVRSATAPRDSVARACDCLRKHDGLVVLPPDTNKRSKYQLYLSADPGRTMHVRLYRLGTPQFVLSSLQYKSASWVVVDPQVWHLRDLDRFPDDTIFKWWIEFEGLLKNYATLVAQFDHLEENRWEFLVEGPGTQMIDEMRLRGDGSILIYELDSIMPADRASEETVTLRE